MEMDKRSIRMASLTRLGREQQKHHHDTLYLLAHNLTSRCCSMDNGFGIKLIIH